MGEGLQTYILKKWFRYLEGSPESAFQVSDLIEPSMVTVGACLWTSRC